MNLANNVKNYLKQFSSLPATIWWMFAAELTIFSLNTAFFLIANIFMAKNGFSDAEIASILSLRFVSVLFFAVPFGIFIKYYKLKPFYYLVTLVVVLSSYFFVFGVEQKAINIVYLSGIFLGFCDSAIRIISISYILRNLSSDKHTAGISLNTISWSGSMITSGLGIALLRNIDKTFFTEGLVLTVFSAIGVLAFLFIYLMDKHEHVQQKPKVKQARNYNWKGIAIASIPIILIATGAGLTIPYINLFFYHSFGIDSDQFALLGVGSSVLIVSALLVVPTLKKRYGYQTVTFTQSLSVAALICLAITDFYSHIGWMLLVAIFCYTIRQPLMNLANPMTMEMTMYYVGKPSQELMASIVSSIWSGAWFFSARIFKVLVEWGLSYGQIFLITAGLYMLGVISYHWLINDYEQKLELGAISVD